MKQAEPHSTFIVFDVGLQSRYLHYFLLSTYTIESCLVSYETTHVYVDKTS